MTSVLVLKKEWLDAIVDGDKRMEIRGSSTRKVGQVIYLMASKTDEIVAQAKVSACIGPMTKGFFLESVAFHKSPSTQLPYKKTFGWILEDVERLPQPIHHKRKQGCIGFSVYHPPLLE